MPCYNEDGYNSNGYNICVPICWNFTARFTNSAKLFKKSGPGAFPKRLKVPHNIDLSTGRMIDDGEVIDPDEYEVTQ